VYADHGAVGLDGQVTQQISKMVFDDLRGACLRNGGILVRQFLDLDYAIDSFAAGPLPNDLEMPWDYSSRMLEVIENRAAELRELAQELGERCLDELQKMGADL